MVPPKKASAALRQLELLSDIGVSRSVKRQITESLRTLSPEERAIVDASYGITTGTDAGDEEIAQQLLLSPEEVKESRDAALRALLGYPSSKNGPGSKDTKDKVN